MKKLFFKLSGLLMFSSLVSACNSPLANHATTSDSHSPTSRRPLKFSGANLSTEVQWASGPNTAGDNSLRLHFWATDTGSRSGPFVQPPFSVSAQIKMSCCGSLAPPAQIDWLPSGAVQISHVNFRMPGDWDVTLQLHENNRVVDEASFRVHVGE